MDLAEIDAPDIERDIYELANLFPRDTGLPMTVWVSPRGAARHDVRIKVHQAHGERINLRNLASVAVRPEPRLVHGELSAADFDAVSAWIALIETVLVDYWDGRASTLDLARRLRPLA